MVGFAAHLGSRVRAVLAARAEKKTRGAPMRGPLQGLMMDFPLTLAPLLERAGKLFGKVEIVSRRPDRTLVRSTYADFCRRARKLARALTDAGLGRGDRVATLMWNHSVHLEAYFGGPG